MQSYNPDIVQFINEHHEVANKLPDFASNADFLLTLYRHMSFTRALDNKAIKLQRTGKMGTYPSTLGQEGIGVGVGAAMQSDDVFCPYYRDQATMLVRGVKASEIFTYWGGDERGSHYSDPTLSDDFPYCVPIATQCLHAAGVAYAIQYHQQSRAVVTTIGEGGTSKGDFYEAMNFAGVYRLPMVFVVNNNQWAISVPRHLQTAADTIAQKAVAAGIDSVRVDGNDVVAVYEVMQRALTNARQGKGPTLVEALSYRLCDHTTADDASRYRPAEEVKSAWQKEPIARLGYYLEAQGHWSKDKEQALQKAINEEIEAAVADYLNAPTPRVTEMFDHLYAQLPDAFHDQYDELQGMQACRK